MLKRERSLVRARKARSVENVGSIGLRGRWWSLVRLVGRLDRVDTYGAVEECGRKQVGVTRTPLNLECPVVCRGKLRAQVDTMKIE